jgi:hypothetical protein
MKFTVGHSDAFEATDALAEVVRQGQEQLNAEKPVDLSVFRGVRSRYVGPPTATG